MQITYYLKLRARATRRERGYIYPAAAAAAAQREKRVWRVSRAGARALRKKQVLSSAGSVGKAFESSLNGAGAPGESASCRALHARECVKVRARAKEKYNKGQSRAENSSETHAKDNRSARLVAASARVG